jgi:ribose transport system substrate-binding protein
MKKFFSMLMVVALLTTSISTALAAPPPQDEGQEYIVALGDWLSKIADKYYGNVLAYPAIVEATNAKHAEDDTFAEITDPDLIEPGWKLWIPSAEEAATYMEGMEAPAAGIKVAVIGKSVHPYWANVEKGVEDAAAALGVQADFFVPTQEDIAAQLSTMEGYIAQGYDGIAVAPSDPTAMQATIQAAMDAGIPVITLDTDAPESARLAYVGTSNKAAGVVAGQEMSKLLPDGGSVAIGTGSLTALNSLERIEGFREGLADNVTVIEPVNNDKEDSATALELANATLVANPDLDGAFGVYAYNGPAWAKAVKEQGKAGEVKIVAFDATDEHIAFLKEGVIDVLIAQREYFQGYNSVELLTEMANKGIEEGMAAYGVPDSGIVDTGVDVVTLAGLADYDAALTDLGIPHTWTP